MKLSPQSPEPNPYSETPIKASPVPSTPSRTVSRLGESAKITAILAIMAFAFWMVKKKLSSGGVTWDKVYESIGTLPWYHFAIALALTVLNYIVLTGYDWIAVRHLRKKLPISKIMAGAVVGYACGNVLGWLLGGNAVRYRMYSTWGFSLLEIIAFVSILSITFWLGLFLLAGVAFVALPIHLPEDVMEKLMLEPRTWGYVFLSCVLGYLMSCLFIRKPIRFRDFEVALPPFKLSVMQLLVSAGDFLLATTVLYSLMPPDVIGSGPDQINFSTVLIAYISAQIAAVITHVPGGYGILEMILLSFLPGSWESQVFSAVILFRVIYYLLPAIVAGALFLYNEYRSGRRPQGMIHGE
jgi:uncharacterized membrane protein YbhN (UPF0104 family)